MQYSEKRLLSRPDCSSCPLRGCNIVAPRGNTRPALALVGEGPGALEDRWGKPFIGPAGQHLSWLCERAKVPESCLWLTNSAMCMPRRKRFLVGTEHEIGYTKVETIRVSTQTTCRQRLIDELNVVRPPVILAVGSYALQSLVGMKEVLKLHGALFPVDLGYGAATVIPMLHPAALLRKPNNTFAVIRVLQKAYELSQGFRQPDSELIRISPYDAKGADAALDKLASLVDLVIADGDDIGVDIETTSEQARSASLTIFGFASLRRNFGCAATILAWNCAAQRFEVCWTPAQAARLYQILLRLQLSRLTKWFWNFGFDTTVLERYFPEIRTDAVRATYADGLHWHWLAQPEMLHNLAFAAQTYLHIGAWKNAFWTGQDAGTATHEDLEDYNARDCVYTIRLVPFLKAELEQRGNLHLVAHQMRVARLAIRAENNGVAVDVDTWSRLHLEYRSRQQAALRTMVDAIRDHAQELSDYVQRCRVADALKREQKTGTYHAPVYHEIAAEDFNPRSPFQARWFLYEFLELTPRRETKGGEDGDNKQASTSYKGVLGYLSKPLVRAYVDYSEYIYKIGMLDAVRAKSTWVEDETGLHPRLFVPWFTCGTKATRWTSKLVNLQNWEKLMRKVLRARPGRCWVGADLAQVEFRIAACLAGLEELITLFNQEPFDELLEPWKKFDGRYDGHSLVAEEVYGAAYRAPAKLVAELMPKVLAYYGVQAPEWKSLADRVSESWTDLYTQVKAALGILGPWRTVVKRVDFALLYGAFPDKILTTLQEDRRLSPQLRASLTLKRITEIWTGFKARWPAWDRWAEQEMHNATHRGYQLIAPDNRRRYWTEPEVESTKVRNTPIQTAAGTVFNILACNAQDRIDAEGLDAVFAIHGHDAAYFDCREGHSTRVQQIVNEEFHFYLQGPRGPVHLYGQASIGATVADVG